MKPVLPARLVALCLAWPFLAAAQAQDAAVLGIKLTVTSRDQQAIHAVAQDLANHGQPVALTIVDTDPTIAAVRKVAPSAPQSVSTTRTGVFTDAQVAQEQARCKGYAARAGVSCAIEFTYGKP